MSTRRFLLVALVLFTALTAVMTYPQVFQMGTGIHDDGDPLLMTWALQWIAHQIVRAPARLFDANIFYPERNTLAYSEMMIVPGLVSAPLAWLGASAIAVYNLVFLSGFVLSGVGVALLVRRLTGHAGAAILAGIVFAFTPFRIDHLPHLQLQQTQFIPLALWAFHRLLDTNRVRDGVILGVCVVGQMLSCLYYGLFLIPYMAVVCGTMLVADRAMPRTRLIALAVAASIVIVPMIPVARSYLAARKIVGERGRQEVVEGSATWTSYLAPAEFNAMYGRVFARFITPERQLFQGFAAVVLAIVGLWPPVTRTRVAYALGLLTAVELSFGFNGIVYRTLYEYVLPFRALRIPARMAIMASFSLAYSARLRRRPHRVIHRGAAHAGDRADRHRPADAGRVRVAAAAAVAGADRSAGSVCGHRARSRRQSHRGPLRVPPRRPPRIPRTVLLDVPLADADQRLQRVFPAVVHPSRGRDAEFSRRGVDRRDEVARRPLSRRARRVSLRRATRR